MCGRYVLVSDAKAIAGHFKAKVLPALHPRFNIAPTQPVPIVRGVRGERVIDLVRWGLIPSWADDIAIGSRLLNARCETAATSGAFRAAMKYRRCLVPADGFYEWKALAGQKRKQPYYLQRADEAPMGLAGLWEHWQDAQGNELETCTILTTDANELVRELHDRMPVILEPDDYARWLDPDQQSPAEVADLLRPFPAEQMMHRPVSQRVGNVRNDDPSLLAPEQPTLF